MCACPPIVLTVNADAGGRRAHGGGPNSRTHQGTIGARAGRPLPHERRAQPLPCVRDFAPRYGAPVEANGGDIVEIIMVEAVQKPEPPSGQFGGRAYLTRG